MRAATTYLLVFALIFAAVSSNPLKSQRPTSPFEVVSVIQLEEPCVRQGGLCLRIEDCEPGNLVQLRGVFCPRQVDLGVECCYM